ncbi:TetR/AcrR family transcriptional regulator [Nocardioides euryhalodurans]|uniref:TetR/AcrR family transcriptional regulator n=1 Tax=Nocardioides euryhalodurans TaxID=2518370 RepID=A0A4P7GK51_9ACTN|nr:TetR family transcriptional regulator [Nocardioides euryhalodurans]QBR92147.1 TetR/AcrR family transcriptional regulator [Nocardioides euryhalodurans]
MTTKRRYDTTGRRAAAEERRWRIAGVAADLFTRQGWSATTIAGVAEAAGVSPELVSGAFGGKAGLFMAAFRHASLGHGGTLPTALAALHLDDEPDVAARLDRIVAFACETLAGMAPLVPVLSFGADQDDELRALMVGAEQRHAQTAEDVVRLLATGPVRDDAVDEVYVLTRAEAYLALVHQRGWSSEHYARWLRRSLLAAVAPDPGA